LREVSHVFGKNPGTKTSKTKLKKNRKQPESETQVFSQAGRRAWTWLKIYHQPAHQKSPAFSFFSILSKYDLIYLSLFLTRPSDKTHCRLASAKQPIIEKAAALARRGKKLNFDDMMVQLTTLCPA